MLGGSAENLCIANWRYLLKDHPGQILRTDLSQRLPRGVVNFYIHFSEIFSRKLLLGITDKYKEQIENAPWPNPNPFING